MFEIKKEWYEIIGIRRSIREYSMTTIETRKLSEISKLTEDINSLSTGVRIEFINKKSNDIFKGLIGGYGKISNSPAYAVFIGSHETPNIEEKIGYYGEAFVLHMAKLGLGTCWVCGTYDKKVAGEEIKLSPGESIFGITPVGYSKEDLKLEFRVVRKIIRSDKRKPMKEVCPVNNIEKLPEWVRISLEAARISPSAVNRQPWKFMPTEKSIRVEINKPSKDKNYSKRLDCGIAMLHIEVGALKKGITGNWKYLADPGVAEFTMDDKKSC